MPRARGALTAALAVAASAVLPAAATASTFQEIDFRGQPPIAKTKVLDAGGLRLYARCATGDPHPMLRLFARSEVDDATLHANTDSSSPLFYSRNELDAGEASEVELTTPLGTGAGTRMGQLVYSAPGGAHVAIHWGSFSNVAVRKPCRFFGTAIVSPGADPPGASLQRISYRPSGADEATTFFERGGLRLRGSCSTAGADDIDVRARSDVANATIHMQAFRREPDGDETQLSGGANDLDPGESLNLLGDVNADDAAIGRFVFSAPGGTEVVGRWLVEERDGYGDSRPCLFAGAARVAETGDSRALAYAVNPSAAATDVYLQNGLWLEGTCEAGPPVDVDILIRTTVDDAAFRIYTQGIGQSGSGGGDSVDPGVTLGFGVDDAMIGALVYSRPNGRAVTTDYLAEEVDGHGGTHDCLFAGAAERVIPG